MSRRSSNRISSMVGSPRRPAVVPSGERVVVTWLGSSNLAAGDAEAGAVAAQRGRGGEPLAAAADHGDGLRTRAGDAHGLAVLHGRSLTEVDRAEVVQRDLAAARGTGCFLNPLRRGHRRGV